MSEALKRTRESLKEQWGLEFKRVCAVAQLLAGDRFITPNELAELTALSHRSIGQITEALAPFLERVEREDERMRLASDYREQAQALFEVLPALADPWEELARQHPALSTLERDLSLRPTPDRHLDHVAATPLTALKRALFLQRQYDLRDAEILLLGDHDMTALALLHLEPDLALAVADIDERLLAFIDETARRRGAMIRTYFCDLRVELPPSLMGQCDLVFTDPPYTPAGVKLFLQRGIQALKGRDFARILLSYGYGEQQVTLGNKVQAVLHELRLLQEAILPRFNHYDNAPALGHRSDLYILRPTRRSLPAAQRIDRKAQIYTQGRLAEESRNDEIPSPLLEYITSHADQRATTPLLWIGQAPAKERAISAPQMDLGAYFKGLREDEKKAYRSDVIANLYPHHADYILRLALCASADELLLCAGARATADLFAHPSPLRALVESRYVIDERIQEGNAALVALRAAPAIGDSGDSGHALLRDIAAHPKARLANAWRETLIRAAKVRGVKLSKNEARTIIQTRPFGRLYGLHYLSELPLHALAQIGRELAHSSAAIDTLTEKNTRNG